MTLRGKSIVSGLLAALALARVGTVSAAENDCGRACLSGVADQVIASIVARDSTRLPLAQVYAATENSIPSALNMMVIWRTATGAKGKYYVIDPESHQVFLVSTIAEGPSDALLFGRIKVDGKLISEVEFFVNRSRGQGGFQFDAEGPAHFPKEWTDTIPQARRATRAELLQAGRSIFDTTVLAPDPAPSCVVMENGKVVAENPDVLKSIGGGASKAAEPAPAVAAAKPKSVPVPCGNPPNRPTDKLARTTIIDEERGVVISMAIVHGESEPYLVTNPTESAYVPEALLQPYTDMLKGQESSGRFKAPAVRAMPATAAVSEMHRIYDGKLQGLHLLVNLGAPGSRSPWVAP